MLPWAITNDGQTVAHSEFFLGRQNYFAYPVKQRDCATFAPNEKA